MLLLTNEQPWILKDFRFFQFPSSCFENCHHPPEEWFVIIIPSVCYRSKNFENLKLSYLVLHYLFLSLASSKFALCENVLANIEDWKSIINSTLFKNAYLFLPSYVDVIIRAKFFSICLQPTGFQMIFLFRAL